MTWVIILLTALVSIISFNKQELMRKLQFIPFMMKDSREAYRFLTYALVHADWMHLGINMFVLYSFGRITEHYYALFFPMRHTFYFLLLYVGGVLISIAPAFAKHRDNPYYAALGASGAVAAVVFASIIIQPMSGILIFPIPFEIPAIIFGVLFLIYSAVMNRRGKDNIGHDTHFWGALYGAALTLILKPELFPQMLQQIGF